MTELIYITGVSPRSGTNFFYECVSSHPSCFASTGGEDYFLESVEHLTDFTDSVYGKWNPRWPIRKENEPGDVFSSLGKGLIHFLRAQNGEVGSSGTHQPIPVAKTPHVQNTVLFPDLFPEGFLLVLLRDGRAVTESTMRTWGTPFDDAVETWRRGGREAIDFLDTHGWSSDWHRAVRYEDLARDTEATLREVFSAIGLEPEAYPYAELNDMPVVNSSTYGRDEGEEAWGKTEGGEDFDPLSRFSAWTKGQHQRFNWLAGDELRSLGYTPQHTAMSSLDAATQLLKDGKRVPGKVKRALSRYLPL